MTAIVDSCIGGKTGINYKNIINSMGSYYHPQNVFISKNMIELLPQREFIAGFAEIIKSGLLNDKKILKILDKKIIKIFDRDFNILREIITLTLKTKIKFFSMIFLKIIKGCFLILDILLHMQLRCHYNQKSVM